jgi:4-hydroxythreonine-4-phosphate dehydrogenase
VSRPVIGLTLGDPAGIGPEIVRAALASGKLDRAFDYRTIGSAPAVNPGRPDEASARLARDALEEAATLVCSGTIAAVVTGPVSKSALQRVGFDFPGQTEFFAARAGVRDFAMCLTGGALTVALVTAHVPLRDVPSLLSTAEIVRVGRLLKSFVARRLGVPPRIAVAGLNPHAGESGTVGREEIEIIEPAVRLLGSSMSSSATVVGPIPPDTVFHRAVKGEFDAVLCMYHDQGLIPLKLHAFDVGVNITLGFTELVGN